MKYFKLFIKIIEIATFVIPVAKGIGIGVYSEYKKNAKKVKEIWNT
jgi:hypothetical protein